MSSDYIYGKDSGLNSSGRHNSTQREREREREREILCCFFYFFFQILYYLTVSFYLFCQVHTASTSRRRFLLISEKHGTCQWVWGPLCAPSLNHTVCQTTIKCLSDLFVGRQKHTDGPPPYVRVQRQRQRTATGEPAREKTVGGPSSWQKSNVSLIIKQGTSTLCNVQLILSYSARFIYSFTNWEKERERRCKLQRAS